MALPRQVPEAEASWRAALASDPTHAESCLNLAISLQVHELTFVAHFRCLRIASFLASFSRCRGL